MKSVIKLIFAAFFSMAISQLSMAQAGDWTAPEEANNLKNPLTDEAAIEEGKTTYSQLCVICHGAKGKGDGIAGMNLNPRPGNLSSPKIQDQTDGAIFWKLTEGRTPMAAYKDLLSEEKRWQLVTYIRQLANKKKK